MKRLGFIGTGAITSAMVKGLAKSKLGDWPIFITPRSRERAEELAATIPTVTIATDNQAVADASNVVFLAIRPQIAAEVISMLAFRPEHVIVSLVAGMSMSTIKSLVGENRTVVRAIPLPAVESCTCATPITPPHAEVAAFFDALGTSICVDDESQFDGYVAASAVMATYFGIVTAAANWMVDNGINTDDADSYMRNLFGNLGDVLRARSDQSFDQLREDHTTKGGLNEMVHDLFLAKGGAAALQQGLDAVLARVRK